MYGGRTKRMYSRLVRCLRRNWKAIAVWTATLSLIGVVGGLLIKKNFELAALDHRVRAAHDAYVVGMEKTVNATMMRAVELQTIVDFLIDVQTANDEVVGATLELCGLRTEYVRRLYDDNVILAQRCTNVPLFNGRLFLAPPQPDPGFLPNHEECVKQALGSVRFSSDDLLPAGAMEQGGIMPMLNFMKGAQAPQVEVPPRPPTAAELRRRKGSVVVP